MITPRDTHSTVHHGDGTTTTFAINFAFPNAAAIEVVERDDASKAERILSQGKDYSVTGGGAKAGRVKMTEAPASGKTVIIRTKPAGVSTAPKVSPLVMIGAAAAGVIVVGLSIWIFVFSSNGTTASSPGSPLLQVTADDITLGSPNAPIIMIEYASLGCPACAYFQMNVVPDIKKNYVDTGLVYYVFRNFPHTPAAMSATLVAACMPRENYLKFADILFASQNLWEAPGANVKEGLVTVARRAGMTRERVEQCLADEAKFQEIRTAQERATAELGVASIPTFFVNGRLVGPGSYADFDNLFKSLLTQMGIQPPATNMPATPAPAETSETPEGETPTSPESAEPESDTTPPSP